MNVADNTIGQWLIGPFIYDPSDDSHFWEERNLLTGEIRLAHTGPYRDGIYINGNPLISAGIIHIPNTPDEARDFYLEVAHEILRRLNDHD